MFKKEDHRETIAYEIIKNDLIKRYNFHFRQSILAIAIMAIIGYGYIKMITHFESGLEYSNFQKAIIIFITVMYCLIFLANLIFAVYSKHKVLKVKKHNFTVHTDFLVSKERPKVINFNHLKNDYWHFRFARFGIYYVYCEQYNNYIYPWSENYAMNLTSFIRNSDIDDEFYIVTVGKSKRIQQIYNKKIFVLEEK